MEVVKERLRRWTGSRWPTANHKAREDGMCALEAVAWLAGEPHTDHPKCVSQVIGAFVRYGMTTSTMRVASSSSPTSRG